MSNRHSVRSDQEQSDSPQGLPEDAVFACAYSSHLQPFDFEVAVFYRRAGVQDELWIATGPIDSRFPQSWLQALARGEQDVAEITHQHGISVSQAAIDTTDLEPSAACAQLLGRQMRLFLRYGWPKKFLVAGILQQPEWQRMKADMHRKLRRNAKKAERYEAEIIDVARELKLKPMPSGLGPDSWTANCPETNHRLFISASTDSFTCPWCREKGGGKELRAFVGGATERRQRREARRM